MAHAVPSDAVQMETQSHPPGVLLRTIVIGLTAFLTVVDLFATQAILPSLARAYQVTPAAMGFAANSTTARARGASQPIWVRAMSAGAASPLR